MNSDVIAFPTPLAFEYLQHIEALTAEIKAGIDAIGSNALSTFEESVLKQQVICASICQLTGQMRQERAMDKGMERDQEHALSGQTRRADRALADRILIAAELLLDLNQQYAALLKHSGESVRLFSVLCRSYTEQFQSPAQLGANGPVWSCQS